MLPLFVNTCVLVLLLVLPLSSLGQDDAKEYNPWWSYFVEVFGITIRDLYVRTPKPIPDSIERV